MDKLRILNLFAIAFLVSLLVQYWFFPKQVTPPILPDVYISVESENIIVPNIPKITIHNTTTGAITVNPCDDITLSLDSKLVTGIRETAIGFCAPIIVAPSQIHLILFAPLYRVFATQPGKYVVTIKTPLGDRSIAFSLALPGSFRSVASTLVYEPIYNLFIALLTWVPGHSLGWAIIIITLIIRLILLVPQQHMLESQKKLQKIQPKIKAIQKEFKTDQAVLGQKMMELYKTEGVNPMGSCLPLLIQMPILIGLYWVISGITDPSNLYHLYPIFESFQPSNIVTTFFGLNLSQIGGITAIIFGLILGGTQWVQAYMSFHYTIKTKKETQEPKKEVDPTSPEAILDPEMMQKMMLYMLPVMLAVSSYFFPLGIALYWFIGTLFVIAQQWYVNNKK
ncbi:YidC/Oxa1 family membrane protein insertase [Candidatus Gracilibacteria bacterium]|nr:YidC/Oxa1 family membrane protein insertase [Candidatus Gracilibacteria bacterium]